MTLVALGLIRAPTVVGASRLRVNDASLQYTPHVPPTLLVTVLLHNAGLTSKKGRIVSTTSYTFPACCITQV